MYRNLQNVQFYANHPRLDELWNSTECVFKSKKSMFTVTVTDEAALFFDRKKMTGKGGGASGGPEIHNPLQFSFKIHIPHAVIHKIQIH